QGRARGGGDLARRRGRALARRPRPAARLGLRGRLRPRDGADAAAGRAGRLRDRHRRRAQRRRAGRTRLRPRRARLARVRAHRRVAPPRGGRAARSGRRRGEGAVAARLGADDRLRRSRPAARRRRPGPAARRARQGRGVRRLLVALAAALALAAACATASTARPQAGGRFVVVFAPPRNGDERILVSLLRAAQLPQVFAELSKHMKLPRTITISVQGGSAGPYYSAKTRTIVLNHPFSALALNVFHTEYPRITQYHLGELFAELEYFVLFHELGHALIDQWNIPVLGKEEDAVDAFSTIVMTDIVRKGEFALAGADFFYYLAGSGHLKEVDFADEHSLDKQR